MAITSKLRIEGTLREHINEMSVFPVGDEYKLSKGATVGEDKDIEKIGG